jgi:hypothetical protein
MTDGLQPPSEPPQISGRLSETPLFAVFRRLQREGLSGTLSVIRGDQVRQLVFENGELHAARSSREEHRIGATLVRWGYISEEDLHGALEEQKRTHQRIDRILVEKGLVTRVVVDSEARRQMEQIVFSTLSWPEGSFHFEANTGPLELDVATALSQEMIIEGIRRIPESEQFLELLGDLSNVPTLTRDPMSTGSLRLLRDAVGLISRIDGTSSLRELLGAGSTAGTAAGTASAKILYSLLFAGIIEVHPAGEPALNPERRVSGRRAADRGRGAFAMELSQYKSVSPTETGFATADPLPLYGAPAPGEPNPPLSPRDLVLQTHRQLDWLSHYDLLGVSRKATTAQIEEAYRSRSLLFDPSLKAHPELVDCWRQLTVLTKWLRVAHRVLSNAETREAYDRKIDGAVPPDPLNPPR